MNRGTRYLGMLTLTLAGLLALPAASGAVQTVPLAGEQSGDQFGLSVASAGDVNNDGFADVIVGAPSHPSASARGRAYVYFGGPAMDAVPDLTLEGEANGDYFGISVAPAGDVNGDTYDDVVVGAFRYGANAGRAYVYYGGPGLDAVADLTFTGVAGDEFGSSVASAGDFNGDGKDDVIVGAYVNTSGGGAGRAFVFYGGSDDIADLVFTGAASNDNLGYSVSGAGDVNHDGYADVIVGALNNDVGGLNAGRAYVYFGGPGADAVADLTLTGEAADDRFGLSVASAGDLNGDTYDDVIVGAFQNDAGGGNAGRAYVYYGGVAPDPVADVTLTGLAASERFGISVATAGDVTEDGYPDLIVGAFGNGAHGGDTGRAYLFLRGPGADTVPDLTFTGASAGDRLGISVASAGDVDGDGRADLIVGADQNGTGNPGAAFVYLTTPPLPAASPAGLGLIGLLVLGPAVMMLRRRIA